MAPIHADVNMNGSKADSIPKSTLPEVETENNGNKRYSYEMLVETANFLLSRTTVRPIIGVICGSGMGSYWNEGSLAENIADAQCIPYDEIPNFPISTVEGHHGQLVFGYLNNVPVVAMQGRFHYYEGYPLWKVRISQIGMPYGFRAFESQTWPDFCYFIKAENFSAHCPQHREKRSATMKFGSWWLWQITVRVMKLLGVKTLVATNAAGGLNPNYKIGDLMIVKDHINMMGFAGNNPLHGPNDERFGPRFPPMNKAYNYEYRKIAKEVAKELNIQDIVREGVYTCLGGPNFETVAEINMLKMVGVDAVGMSTVHEVITARHCDMNVFGLSLITNECITSYEHESEANHEEVLDVGRMRQDILRGYISKLVDRFATILKRDSS